MNHLRYAFAAALGVAIALVTTGAALAEPSDLISVWQFDEDAEEFASGFVRDSADDNDGMVDGATSSSGAAAIFGRAVDFDGTDDQITVPNAANLDFTAAYTLETWVFSDDISVTGLFRPIFFRGADDSVTNENDIEVYIQLDSKDLIVAHNRNNGGTFGFVGFADPPLGEWFHLAVVFDGTDVLAYYNGVPAAVVQGVTATIAPLATGKDWLFGKVNHFGFTVPPSGQGRQNYFDGRLDEVRFYDRALTAGEVEARAMAGMSLDLTIDIKPGSDPNSINLCGAGVIPVAIFGSDDFPVSDIDVSTLRLGDGTPVSGSAVKIAGKSGKKLCSTKDVDFDGFEDLVCKFVTVDLDLDGGAMDATVLGSTTGGQDFVGTDSVNIVKDDCG